MKKSIFLLSLLTTLLFTSCKKEEQVLDCNCGKVTQKTSSIMNGTTIYSLTVENYCTKFYRNFKFYFHEKYLWENAKVNRSFCHTTNW